MPTLQEQLQTAVDQTTADSTTFHDIVHGDTLTEVITQNGNVKSLAKVVAENQQTLNASIATLTAMRDQSVASAGNAALSESNSATSESNSANSEAKTLAAVGAVANKYLFDDIIVMDDPTAGVFNFDNADLLLATNIAISAQNAETTAPDISAFINTWGNSTSTVKGVLTIKKVGAPAVFAIFAVTGAVTNNATWLQVPLTYITGNGAFVLSDELYISFSRNGDKGEGLGDITVDTYVDGVDYTSGVDDQLILTTVPPSDGSVSIFFDGVYQESTEWNRSGSTITIIPVIPIGISSIEIKTLSALDIGTPSDGSVTSSKITSDIIAGQAVAAITANDYIVYSDISDSNKLKKDTLAGLFNVNKSSANEYIKAQNFNATLLVDAATIVWDAESNQVASVTLAGNRILGAPSNLKDGATYILIVKQDATGNRTLAYNAVYKFPGGVAPTLSIGANAADILSFVSDGINMYGALQGDFN